METLIVPAGIVAQQIDIPEGVERSVKGALYIRPASTLECTISELEFLQEKHGKLYAKLIHVQHHKELDVHAHLKRRLAHEKDPKMRSHIQAHLNLAPDPVTADSDLEKAAEEHVTPLHAPVKTKKHEK